MPKEEKLPFTAADAGGADAASKKSGSGRKNRKFKRNFRKKEDFSGQKSGNDFAFWNEYPELMDIATRIPWMHIAGTMLSGVNVDVALPNVAVQYYLPVAGIAASPTDPINVMFRSLYLDMHRKYRGIGTYEASDIAITVICIESVLQLIVECERVYGILNNYPLKSRIEPDALLNAMGFSNGYIADIKSNMADYRYRLNRLINMAKRLPLPNGMNFFKNHLSLNAFVYKDSADERAALIVFQSRGYYSYKTQLDPEQINSAGTAYFVKLNRFAQFSKYYDFLHLIELELTKLLKDSDILRITSDFIACYGESNMQVLMPLEENFVVNPVYDEAILSKWHNSERFGKDNAGIGYAALDTGTTTLTWSGLGDNFAIYQRVTGNAHDTVVCMPTIFAVDETPVWAAITGNPGIQLMFTPAGNQFTKIAHVLDSWQPEPDKATICEAMLWKCHGANYSQGSGEAYLFTTACTEILLELKVFAAVSGTAYSKGTLENTDAQFNNTYFQDSGIYHFDWHPYVLSYDNNREVNEIYGDTDNVTVTTVDVVQKIHDAALLSAFKVNISGSKSSE